jgi:hypothetical protein
MTPFLLSISFLTGVFCSKMCVCVPGPKDISEAVRASVEGAAAVFVAQVDSVSFRTDSLRTDDGQHLRLELVRAMTTVQAKWKGSVDDKAIVWTDMTSCGADLRPGIRYLIYASADSAGTLHTNQCHRTRQLSKAGEDIAVLSKLGVGQK